MIVHNSSTMAHDSRDLEWQRRYEEKDTPWDKGEPAPPLAKFLGEGGISGRVLVPGCGKGHDVRALGVHSDISVLGLDLAPSAVEQAKDLAQEAKSGPNVGFIVGDFFQLPDNLIGSFDWLVEHTCFCALPPELRADYLRGAVTALRKGGKIFGIFYLTPDVEMGPPFAISREEISRIFDPHFELLEEWVPRECFSGRENRELVRILQKR